MIIVGMSGGVDSSVSALLLARGQTPVRGVFMNNWEDGAPECRADEDRRDALRICGHLGLPFATVNFAKTYRDQVFAHFLDGYAKGFTPNPDILCNREVKFKVFLDWALSQGADKIATGHYVQKDMAQGRARLLRGKDPGKDQSYFLHAIPQDALMRSEFPVGHLDKSEVRRLAEANGLVTARKKDSTGICFIGEQDFKSFLAKYLPASPGRIETECGRDVGAHQGALYYTIGQRAPVGGIRGADARPWWIIRKDVVRNVLVITQNEAHPSLLNTRIRTDRASWIDGVAPGSVFEAEVQVRHLGRAVPASVRVNDDETLDLRLHAPINAAAPGQSAVLYQGAVCLGGATISKAGA